MRCRRESYHHMCRYFSGFFHHHPLLADFDYYWRIEPTCTTTATWTTTRSSTCARSATLPRNLGCAPSGLCSFPCNNLCPFLLTVAQNPHFAWGRLSAHPICLLRIDGCHTTSECKSLEFVGLLACYGNVEAGTFAMGYRRPEHIKSCRPGAHTRVHHYLDGGSAKLALWVTTQRSASV